MKTNLIAICQSINLKNILNNKGYIYFDRGSYNLNIVGVRRGGVECTDTFKDALIVEYKDLDDKLTRKVFPCTTVPGLYYLENTVNCKGCAILVPNQYRGAYMLGKHKGKYEALCQRKNLKVYRDNNKNNIYDFDADTINEGIFGINIHKAGTSSIIVHTWSAGCQVLQKAADFKVLMELCHKQIENGHGNTFTYTLIEEADLHE